MRIAIVIPAYGEVATIRAIAEQALHVTPLVIVVDDGSSDGTSDVLAGLPLQLVRHAQNQGKAAALRHGFELALAHEVDYVATLDGDGQHLPQDVRRLAAATQIHSNSIVVGARLHEREAAPLARRCANRFADFWISWAAGYPIADSQSGERLYPVALLRAVQARDDWSARFTFESEVLIRAAELGHASVAVPISTIYASRARRSHFRPARDIAGIVVMVAKALLARRMNVPGLWNSLRRPPTILDPIAAKISDEPCWKRV